MSELTASLEYRSELQGALDRARQALPPAQFNVVARGIRAELNGADERISDLRLENLRPCIDCTTPVFVRIAREVRATLEPHAASPLVLEDELTIWRNLSVPSRIQTPVPFAGTVALIPVR